MGIAPEEFKRQKYYVLRNVISPEICQIFINYAKFQSQFDFTVEKGEESQSSMTHSKYADFLTESLLLYLQPKIENCIGESLFPTFSYYRLYKQGDVLEPHVDRESCEVCVSVAFGWPSASQWTLKIANDKIYYNDTNECLSIDNGIAIDLAPGDCLIFVGTEVKHWRDALTSSMYAQAFFHYVRASGEKAAYKFDERESIGMPKISEDYEYVKHSRLMQTLFSKYIETKEKV